MREDPIILTDREISIIDDALRWHILTWLSPVSRDDYDQEKIDKVAEIEVIRAKLYKEEL